jgi:hypothetical protein
VVPELPARAGVGQARQVRLILEEDDQAPPGTQRRHLRRPQLGGERLDRYHPLRIALGHELPAAPHRLEPGRGCPYPFAVLDHMRLPVHDGTGLSRAGHLSERGTGKRAFAMATSAGGDRCIVTAGHRERKRECRAV